MFGFISLSDDALALIGCGITLIVSCLTLQLVHFLQQGHRSKPPPLLARPSDARDEAACRDRDASRVTHDNAV